MKNLRQASDEELVLEINENNNEEAKVILFERYKIHATKLAKAHYKFHGSAFLTLDDLISTNFALTLNCIENYKNDRRTSFHTYWVSACCNEMRRVVANARKCANGREFVSLQTCIAELSNIHLDDIIGQIDPHIFAMIDCNERLENIEEFLQNKATPEEKRILIARLKGQSFKDMALEMNENEKHLRYVFTRIAQNIN